MYYYPQAGASYMTPQVQQMGLKGRPVSSLEEARAAQIDFDGSMFIFPDMAHHRIYTKQISSDGTASLNMYELTQLPSPVSFDDSNYITRDEFNAAMAEIKGASSEPSAEKPSPAFKF